MKTVRVGVTGHRAIPHPAAARDSVRDVLRRIEDRARREAGPAVRLVAVSPLAEGADRLVAEEVLGRSGASLEVPLPLGLEDYLRDFSTPASAAAFQRLLGAAARVHHLPPTPTRDDAYRAVGRFVVDRSDVVVALWDGQGPRGRGGTAEVVAYARFQARPLYWVHTELPARITEECTDAA